MRVLLLVLLMPLNVYGLDIELNFEKSCYSYYGAFVREEIISEALKLVNFDNSPRRFVRGQDIFNEIDETNYTDYLWNPLLDPTIEPSRPRPINPVVCDSDGSMQVAMRSWFPWNVGEHIINGFAGRSNEDKNSNYCVYIAESHGITPLEIENWSTYEPMSNIILGGHMTKEQHISLLAHEILHLLRVRHAQIVKPISDTYFPIMWPNNFALGGIQQEDIDLYWDAVKSNHFGDDRGFSFESTVMVSPNYIRPDSSGVYEVPFRRVVSIDLRVNIPDEFLEKDLEFLALAQVDGKWLQFTSGGWVEFDGVNLKGIEFYSDKYFISKNVFSLQYEFYDPVKIYFGVRQGNEIYYNSDKPMFIRLSRGVI